MNLNLSVNGQVLDKISLDPSRCKDERYLRAVRRLLAIRNHRALAVLNTKPTYYIEVPSRMMAGEFLTA
jgi:hypothetical protein